MYGARSGELSWQPGGREDSSCCILKERGNNMVEMSFTNEHLHLEVKGMDKLWAFKSQLEIPRKIPLLEKEGWVSRGNPRF